MKHTHYNKVMNDSTSEECYSNHISEEVDITEFDAKPLLLSVGIIVTGYLAKKMIDVVADRAFYENELRYKKVKHNIEKDNE